MEKLSNNIVDFSSIPNQIGCFKLSKSTMSYYGGIIFVYINDMFNYHIHLWKDKDENRPTGFYISKNDNSITYSATAIQKNDFKYIEDVFKAQMVNVNRILLTRLL